MHPFLQCINNYIVYIYRITSPYSLNISHPTQNLHLLCELGSMASFPSAEFIFVHIIGNIGVLFVVLAYIALSFSYLSSASILYSLVNLCGSMMIGTSLFYKFNLPSVIIESCWTAISLFGLIKALLRRLSKKRQASKTSHINPHVVLEQQSSSPHSQSRLSSSPSSASASALPPSLPATSQLPV